MTFSFYKDYEAIPFESCSTLKSPKIRAKMMTIPFNDVFKFQVTKSCSNNNVAKFADCEYIPYMKF